MREEELEGGEKEVEEERKYCMKGREMRREGAGVLCISVRLGLGWG